MPRRDCSKAPQSCGVACGGARGRWSGKDNATRRCGCETAQTKRVGLRPSHCFVRRRTDVARTGGVVEREGGIRKVLTRGIRLGQATAHPYTLGAIPFRSSTSCVHRCVQPRVTLTVAQSRPGGSTVELQIYPYRHSLSCLAMTPPTRRRHPAGKSNDLLRGVFAVAELYGVCAVPECV